MRHRSKPMPWSGVRFDATEVIPGLTEVWCDGSAVVPGAEGFTARDWQNVRERGTLDDVPLYQLGFWNTLMRALSMEAISLGIDARGYDHPTYNWNAVEAMIFFYSDYAQDVQYLYSVAGYMEVTVGFAREFIA